MEQLPPPPLPPPGELKELPEDKQKKKLGAPREKTKAEIWLGPEPEDIEDSDVDVQGKAPLEGKYSDQSSEGSDKAPGVRYQ